jgi:diacylglycerol kinase (ATP)
MKKNKTFSLNERSKSFKYAFEGIKTFFKTEQNARIHLLATIAVIVLSIIFPVSKMEAIALILTVGFVWVAEIFNTAIEKMMDFISEEKNLQIKNIKDLSAAAVLTAALIAVVTGCFIFIPKL